MSLAELLHLTFVYIDRLSTGFREYAVSTYNIYKVKNPYNCGYFHREPKRQNQNIETIHQVPMKIFIKKH